MMALEAKAIKEEMPDKEIYETNNIRRGKGKDQCKTPDSPEGARAVAVAPRSPISPQIHHTNLILPRTNHRNGSLSPIINGNLGQTTTVLTTTPPPPLPPTTTTSVVTTTTLTGQPIGSDTTRALIKIRRFLGALVQFGQDSSPDVGDRVRSLVLSLASNGLSAEEFKIALQEVTNFPVRQNVLPFLRSHIPLLQREVTSLARANNQQPLQYVRANENCVVEFVHNQTEHTDIFLPIDGGSTSSSSGGGGGGGGSLSINGNGHSLKRRGSENFLEHQNGGGQHEWNEYLLPAKRQYHSMMIGTSAPNLYPSHPQFFDYQNGPHLHNSNNNNNNNNETFANMEKQNNQRDERSDVRMLSTSDQHRRERSSGEEEWKNIHTMLTCISAMVEKTKRAITILQQRSSDGPTSYPDASLAEIKRQTEEKVAEFRRNAEDAVNQVKRQAVIEIQRAVSTAENRAVEIMAQERLKMEKFFSELNKTSNESLDGDSQSPVQVQGTQNVCWNCGRKANETCSGCNLARYCGAFCQHKDWEQHHQICGSTRIETTTSTITQTTKNQQQNIRQIVGPPARLSPPQIQHTSLTNGVK